MGARLGHLTLGPAASMLLLCIACLSFSGCEPRDVDSELRQAVADFHSQYSAQNFNQIYDRSSRLFRRRLSREANAQFFSTKYGRYGRVLSSERTDKVEQSVPTGRIYVLTYSTKFERGASTELLVFRDELSERGLLLAAYELN